MIILYFLVKIKINMEKKMYYINIDIKVIDYDKFINRKSRLNVEEKKRFSLWVKTKKITKIVKNSNKRLLFLLY